jgi:lipoic acid synthetase
MLYIDTSSNEKHECGFYFGLEEYLIKDFDFDDDIFLLWNVVPTVMIGRHQVTTLEIDQNYVNDNQIQVVRRNSGGGAVYTDKGCLQFSFITNNESHTDIFKDHVKHIVEAVNKLGLKAEFTGRNDILHEGRKFSGNAEFIHGDKMVIHGTILFESNMDHLIGSLTPDKAKLTKHAVTSVKSRVLNIGSLLDVNINDFYTHVVNEIKTTSMNVEELDLNKITAYSEKFYTDEWNYGKNPRFDFTKKVKLDAGNITFSLIIKNNKVNDLKITGDYFSLKKITDFENAFIGSEFSYDGFLKVLKKVKVKEYIYKLKTSEFLGVFFERPKKRLSKPEFLKIDMHNLNKETKKIRTLLKQHNLYTVCQEASCPNQLECFSNKTATFMILGNHCTRNCRFCDVEFGHPLAVDPKEPEHLLRAVQVMQLKHIVITSVTRDDLPDYGSKQFVKVIELLKQEAPDTTVEVLIPDFMGDYESIKRVVDAKPDVINHNLETIKRLYDGFRDNASYERSLGVLETVKQINPDILTKSGIMVGIGETKEEVFTLMEDLRHIKCDIMTIGQYLQPSKNHVDVIEYVSLEQFKEYEEIGKAKGFRYIASGPMVRSSYQALKQFEGE